MTRKERVYEFLRRMKFQYGPDAAYSAEEVAHAIGAARANVSNDLNRLLEEGLVERLKGRPVRYGACATVITPMPGAARSRKRDVTQADDIFDSFIGYNGSMRSEIEKAKAAVLYPPNGLPMLIQGETGVGKTMFAQLLFTYAKRIGRMEEEARFISFNCADYANNPQLILSQLFGHVKGAFTGADRDKAGLVEEADGGVLFLDECHRLPSEAQEMLFTLIDFGQYRRLGEAANTRSAHPMIILATTEAKEVALLATFIRRIPVNVYFPPLAERSTYERLKLVEAQFRREAVKLGVPIHADGLAIKALMAYDCPGNVGQLKNDIKVVCAKAYVRFLAGEQKELSLTVRDLPRHIKEGLGKIRQTYSEINLIVSNFVFPPEDGGGTRREQMNVYDYLEERYSTLERQEEDPAAVEGELMGAVELYFSNLICGNYNEGDADAFVSITEEASGLMARLIAIVREEMGLELNLNDQMALASHLNATLRRIAAGKRITCPFLGQIRREQPQVYAVALHIAELLNGRCDMDTIVSEAGILANFLLQIVKYRTDQEGCCAVVVCSQAEGAARAMANVANEILDGEPVVWLEDAGGGRQALVEALAEKLGGKNGVLLADRPEWKELADQAALRCGVQLRAITNVNTSMVIEAGILAYEKKLSAEEVYHRLQLIENEAGLMDERHRNLLELGRHPEDKSKAIITVCISGCGAAVRLKQIIEKRFVIPAGIDILTMDIGTVREFEEKLENILAVYSVLCIVGMDMGLELGCPLISTDDFILGSGRGRFAAIVEPYGVVERGLEAGSYDSAANEKMLLSGQRLSGYLAYLDGEKLAPYVNDVIACVEREKGPMERGKRMMFFLHMCCMVERLLFEVEPGSIRQEDGPEPDPVFVEAVRPLKTAYRLTVPNSEYEMMGRIMGLAFKNE